MNPKADLLSEIIWILSYKIAHKIRERIICHDMRKKKQIDTRGEDEMKKKKKKKKEEKKKKKKKKKKNEEEEGEENKRKQNKRINTQTSVRS